MDITKIPEEVGKFFTFFASGEFVKIALTSAIASLTAVLTFVLGWLPSLPSLPSNIESQIYQFFDFPFTSGAIGFIGWIFGSWTIPHFVFTSAIAIYIFRISYDFIILVLTKIPVLGVKR